MAIPSLRPFGLLERNDLHVRAQLVQVVSPNRHHPAPFGEVGSAVVRAAEGVADSVGELVLDHVGAKGSPLRHRSN